MTVTREAEKQENALIIYKARRTFGDHRDQGKERPTFPDVWQQLDFPEN